MKHIASPKKAEEQKQTNQEKINAQIKEENEKQIIEMEIEKLLNNGDGNTNTNINISVIEPSEINVANDSNTKKEDMDVNKVLNELEYTFAPNKE